MKRKDSPEPFSIPFFKTSWIESEGEKHAAINLLKKEVKKFTKETPVVEKKLV